MEAFNELVRVLDCLLSPEGCPWDREQTLFSMRSCLLEEACEVIEAIDLNDVGHIEEELGDLLFISIFLCRLAEKENKCSLETVLREVINKLIRRHPHVFADTEIRTSDQVLEQWNEIKSKEKGKEKRESAIDGIPVGMPALARAQKIIKKMSKNGYSFETNLMEPSLQDRELELGEKLMRLIGDPLNKELDAEQALRRILALHEVRFREYEISKMNE